MAMSVKQLMAKLSKCDPDQEVVICYGDHDAAEIVNVAHEGIDDSGFLSGCKMKQIDKEDRDSFSPCVVLETEI